LTEVAFHFGAPDKLAYAVRLLRKAVGSGARVLVLAPPVLLQQLDVALWASAPTDFLPHCLLDAPEKLRSLSLVVLADEGSVVNAPDLPVLVNLGAQMPQGFEHHKRLIEVVSTDEEDRATARQRWKTYTARGLDIIRHDLQLRA
jgi:DNA polymerase-3 subunit chi